MKKEYFLDTSNADLFNSDNIFDTSCEEGECHYLVSNTTKVQAEVYSPEVDFYLENTEDPIAAKRDHIKKLYDAKAAVFEYSDATELSSLQRRIQYDPLLCLSRSDHQEICGRCTDICPSRSIIRSPQSSLLEVHQADCASCGQCVAVCPTGALEYAKMPRSLFQEICALYRDNIVLLLPDGINIEELNVRLPENVLPFMLEHDGFLDEGHFLTLVQTTGNPVILYTETVSELTDNIVRLINEIFDRAYQRQAVFLCRDAAALKDAFERLAPLPQVRYLPEEDGMKKREAVARRLAQIIGENNFGVIETGPYLQYGTVEVNGENCTLCAGCVHVCRAGALTVDPEHTVLQCNPSLCTGCGYCGRICPEKNCLQMKNNRLMLAPEFFRENALAKDQLFRCSECGAGFAPAKSIKKVAAMMTPFFDDDPVKLKTLSCCPDCKAKIMLESGEHLHNRI